MFGVSKGHRYFMYAKPADMRKGFDGLKALVEAELGHDPLSGHLFVFRSRRGDRLKILAWDRSGFWVLYKRLEQGTFAWPADTDAAPVEMRSADLLLLLAGTDLAHTRRRRWYERVA